MFRLHVGSAAKKTNGLTKRAASSLQFHNDSTSSRPSARSSRPLQDIPAKADRNVPNAREQVDAVVCVYVESKSTHHHSAGLCGIPTLTCDHFCRHRHGQSTAMNADDTFACSCCHAQQSLEWLGLDSSCSCLVCRSCMQRCASSFWQLQAAELQLAGETLSYYSAFRVLLYKRTALVSTCRSVHRHQLLSPKRPVGA